MQYSFVIVGGGIAGLSTALALKKIGIEAMVIESAPKIEAVGAGISLAANAMQALKHLGISESVIQAGRQLNAFSIYNPSGKVISRSTTHALDAEFGISNFTTHRAQLHAVLSAQLKPEQILLGKRCQSFLQHTDGYTLHFEDGSQLQAQYLLIADGIRSRLRQQLLPESTLRYAGCASWRGVVHIPEAMPAEASETWGPQGRFGIVPLANNQVYWFATKNANEPRSPLARYTKADLMRNFATYHTPIRQLLEATEENAIIYTDIFDLSPIPRYAFGHALLLGDAAHATTPNMGQGACLAIEDAAILASCLKKTKDVALAFRQFEQKRMARARDIVEQSWRLGQVAQWENSLLVGLRNTAFRLMPQSLSTQQLRKIYSIRFE
ncbi:FAD-dependent monooxygenase [Cytophagales bacterium LB-30]|uniref:FAD-dependent monooxygenase n=1 Tax=Shiella aurantiaca TaxID=3058365 RepID=A0ABT8F6H1_9BACT|nr:FAD-dependent monooxygenase [Shiella aurantiaca]MDN4165869.1 FAD-dependent monooxygenase [Shiella aurantiaca]